MYTGQRLEFSSAIPLEHYTDLFDQAALQIEGRPQISDDVTPFDDDVMIPGQDDAKPAYHPVVTGLFTAFSQIQSGK